MLKTNAAWGSFSFSLFLPLSLYIYMCVCVCVCECVCTRLYDMRMWASNISAISTITLSYHESKPRTVSMMFLIMRTIACCLLRHDLFALFWLIFTTKRWFRVHFSSADGWNFTTFVVRMNIFIGNWMICSISYRTTKFYLWPFKIRKNSFGQSDKTFLRNLRKNWRKA
jgi:hypothetical protein